MNIEPIPLPPRPNPRAPDLLNEVLGDPRRAEGWSSPELTRACVGEITAHEIVSISRYYLLRKPPVMVDFEPAKVQGKFYVEAKRKWAHEHGIVYLPIFLREKLTRLQLEERLKLEVKQMEESRKSQREQAALRKVRKKDKAKQGYTISDPEVQAFIDEEALWRITCEEKAGYKLRAAARSNRLGKIRREVEVETLSRLRDASLGHLIRHRQSAVAARG